MRGHVFRSGDDGKSWQESKVPTGSSLFGGKVDASGNVVLVGAGSTLLVSSDDGLSFTQPVDTDFHDLATVLPVTDSSRSEEHTSELQSLMRSSYAVFCLKKKNIKQTMTNRVDPHTCRSTE